MKKQLKSQALTVKQEPTEAQLLERARRREERLKARGMTACLYCNKPVAYADVIFVPGNLSDAFLCGKCAGKRIAELQPAQSQEEPEPFQHQAERLAREVDQYREHGTGMLEIQPTMLGTRTGYMLPQNKLTALLNFAEAFGLQFQIQTRDKNPSVTVILTDPTAPEYVDTSAYDEWEASLAGEKAEPIGEDELPF